MTQEAVLQRLGFKVHLKLGGRAFVVEKQNQLFLAKVALTTKERKRIRAEVKNLSSILQASQNLKLSALVLPQIIHHQDTSTYTFLQLKFYDFPVAWSEMEPQNSVLGGRLAPLQLIKPLLSVIADLKKFPHHTLVFKNRQTTRSSLQKELSKLSSALTNTPFELQPLHRYLQKAFPSLPSLRPKLIPTNGDFYFRNFILWQGRVVVADWESACLAPPEEISAYLWMLAFQNPLWQQKWLVACRRQSWFDPQLFNFFAVLTTLRQIHFWLPQKDRYPLSCSLTRLVQNAHQLLARL